MTPSVLRAYQSPDWSAVAAQDLGRVRTRQEDAWSVLLGARFAGQTVDVFAVFDGLGGEPKGLEAATAANENLETVLVACQNADDVLPELEKAVDRTGGMTTAVIGLFPRARPGFGWVLTAGDSAAYRLTPGGRPMLIARKDRAAGGVTSCLGGGLLTANSAPIQFGPGETFAFCTDGVDDVAGIPALGTSMSAPAERLDAAVRELFMAIDAAGAPDNATMILARRR